MIDRILFAPPQKAQQQSKEEIAPSPASFHF